MIDVAERAMSLSKMSNGSFESDEVMTLMNWMKSDMRWVVAIPSCYQYYSHMDFEDRMDVNED